MSVSLIEHDLWKTSHRVKIMKQDGYVMRDDYRSTDFYDWLDKCYDAQRGKWPQSSSIVFRDPAKEVLFILKFCN